jgi:fatty acid desaturase
MAEVLTPPAERPTETAAEDTLRDEAIRQLKKKRDFRAHLRAYLLVNGFLWLVWGVIYAAADGPWFPWPLFPLFGWGIGLAFHAWDVYGRSPFSEQAIEREIERLQRNGGSKRWTSGT